MSSITLHIATVLDGIFDIQVQESDKIITLKQKVQQQQSYSPNLQTFVYRGYILKDESTIKEYNIQNNHYIILLMKVKRLNNS